MKFKKQSDADAATTLSVGSAKINGIFRKHKGMKGRKVFAGKRRKASPLDRYASFTIPNANAAATPYIRPEIAAEEGIFPPPPTLARLEMLRDFEPKMRRALSRMWTEVKVR